MYYLVDKVIQLSAAIRSAIEQLNVLVIGILQKLSIFAMNNCLIGFHSNAFMLRSYINGILEWLKLLSTRMD